MGIDLKYDSQQVLSSISGIAGNKSESVDSLPKGEVHKYIL